MFSFLKSDLSKKLNKEYGEIKLEKSPCKRKRGRGHSLIRIKRKTSPKRVKGKIDKESFS